MSPSLSLCLSLSLFAQSICAFPNAALPSPPFPTPVKVCHAGTCGSCPRAGPRTCPCGKKGGLFSSVVFFFFSIKNLLLNLLLHLPFSAFWGGFLTFDLFHIHLCPLQYIHKYIYTIFFSMSPLAVLLSCTEDVSPCGDTCGRMLACGIHRCSERCHNGPCGSCMQVRSKESSQRWHVLDE